jgi:Na+/proline symporter
VVGENLVKPLFPQLTDRQLLLTMRLSVVVIALISALMAMSGAGIYELVGQASALSLVSLFVPLVAGLYWSRASGLGALLSMSCGMAVWLACEFLLVTELPALIYGLLASFAGMFIGTTLRPGPL